MNRHIALALLAAGAVLAATGNTVVPPPPPPIFPAQDSARLAQFAQAFAQPGQLPDSAGAWQPVLPDSIRLRLQANHQLIATQRDSLRLNLPIQPDSLKAHVHALRDSAQLRRDSYLSTLNPADRAKVAPRFEALDARNQGRRSAIDGSTSHLKSRKGADSTLGN